MCKYTHVDPWVKGSQNIPLLPVRSSNLAPMVSKYVAAIKWMRLGFSSLCTPGGRPEGAAGGGLVSLAPTSNLLGFLPLVAAEKLGTRCCAVGKQFLLTD